MPMSHQRADDTLNESLRGTATPHLWLHTGNPGSAGTANVAQVSSANIARKPVAFNPPVNHSTEDERLVKSDGAVTWTGAQIDHSQEITHFSIWSLLSGGQPEFVGEVQTPKYTGSDGVTVADQDIEVGIEVYAKPS